MLRIRKHVSYSNVALTLILIFAMSGGAYAATKVLITSVKQIKPSVVKQLQGKAGKNGAPGPAGPAGAAGPAGPQGPGGSKGENGTTGANGVSAETTQFNGVKGTCTVGGAEVKSASPAINICNGKEGSPWVAGGTLPAGKSESGAWSSIYTATAANQPMSSPVSFTIPLKAAPETYYIGTNEELAGEKNEAAAIKEGKCKGNPINGEEPEATSGNLCVFAEKELNATEYLFFKVFATKHFLAPTANGIIVASASVAEGEVIAYGHWVVTGN
jgi:hypothetical protein